MQISSGDCKKCTNSLRDHNNAQISSRDYGKNANFIKGPRKANELTFKNLNSLQTLVNGIFY